MSAIQRSFELLKNSFTFFEGTSIFELPAPIEARDEIL